ncbi:E3 ubiquitin-protein ligase RNF19B [Neodiprion pinetum]|uniref:E3 ubiquitin-protein ligase RNF19B n=1 Tax=Neodiprion pinetum TaxID=441929 RepID=UPI001EE06C9E|nr:E3 ubiquitin-protein ligase RNF19A-like [Neodiprion pinetum]XP_046473923.1 E3 ubiquitin-protein ligase RNF19A-like [Neodiprion pinetum]XP_046473931.1 E3 ubiquitin-protein ligase RNF19A-like [Neodiprion pinetum]XP_046473938.1 E3 ubiquitin-protein ligase RNF19A-like [Neodiprion pinetum]
MRKEVESGGGCNGAASRPRRLLPRFSLRRLLYSSPLLGRRFARASSSSNRTAKAKDAVDGRTGDVEKGETRGTSVSSQPQSHTIDMQYVTSKSSVPTNAGTSLENGLMECPLCLAELSAESFPVVQSCDHRSCYDCYQQYLKVEISESRVNIACPECSELLHPTDIRMILNDQAQFEKYEDFMVRRVLAVEPDTRWCPAPDCSFAVIATGCASCPKLRCERLGCDSYFCYHCKAKWHPNQTCDAARAQRSQYYDRSSSLSFSQSDSQHRDDIKPCPRCQVLIVKMDDGSCNHMTCAVCGAEFCWLCMKEISDLHYLSPSGCTFWGKKPWSRKKKILWQLGTLVGAPVGIGLVAGIAVPAMIIGIPVWVGRKLYTRYENANKHKRNAFIAGGVTASVLVSPVLAGLAVGIGVPILLFYVYGVVPVSLCRSGGCGVSTNGAGVRFDFDDENELMGAFGNKNTGDASSIDAASHRGANPSIGEASLSLGSGSQLNDQDVATYNYIVSAGASLAASIASTLLPGGQRLEVQADVASTQRFSLSSETASAATSLSEKSVNASIAPDDGAASTRALAGSVLNFKVDTGTASGVRNTDGDPEAGTTAENHVDTAGQAASLSSLEELASGLAKRARRRPILDRQLSDSSSWTTCGEDGGSERVRFDDHVSFIEADQEAGPSSSCNTGNRGQGRRKRNKDHDQEIEIASRSPSNPRSSNNDSNVDAAAEDHPRERVNVATLRSVFFHNGSTFEREKRLPVIEEPCPIEKRQNRVVKEAKTLIASRPTHSADVEVAGIPQRLHHVIKEETPPMASISTPLPDAEVPELPQRSYHVTKEETPCMASISPPLPDVEVPEIASRPNHVVTEEITSIATRPMQIEIEEPKIATKYNHIIDKERQPAIASQPANVMDEKIICPVASKHGHVLEVEKSCPRASHYQLRQSYCENDNVRIKEDNSHC